MKPTKSVPKSTEAVVTIPELAKAREAMSLWCLQANTRRTEDTARRALVRSRQLVAKRASERAPQTERLLSGALSGASPWHAFWEHAKRSGSF